MTDTSAFVRARRVAGACVALAGLSACAGGTQSSQATIPTAGAAERGRIAAGLPARVSSTGTDFVSDFENEQVVLYPAGQSNPTPIGTISTAPASPYQLAVDKHGTLYVQTNSNTILEYPPGATSPSVTLVEPPEKMYGTGVTVAVGDDGTVYAADLYGGDVFEFPKGATRPQTTIPLSGSFGLAVDKKNTLFISSNPGDTGGSGLVWYLPSGSTQYKSTNIKIQEIGGLAVSKSHLLVGDQGAQTITVYNEKSYKLERTISVAPNYPYQFALDHTGTDLYVAGPTGGGIVIYDFASGTQIGTITQGLGSATEGVAVSPPAPI
jgi:hypothetical protein